LVGVGVACLPAKADETLAVVREELAKMARDGISSQELARGKGQLRGSLVLGLEDSGARMSRLGKAELSYEGLMSVDEILAAIDAVTLEQVNDLAAELFTRPEILVTVGPRPPQLLSSASPQLLSPGQRRKVAQPARRIRPAHARRGSRRTKVPMRKRSAIPGRSSWRSSG